MHLHLASPVLALDAGQVVSFACASGSVVRAKFGALWITEEDCLRDHIVRDGAEYRIARDGRTVIQAIDAAVVEIREAA